MAVMEAVSMGVRANGGVVEGITCKTFKHCEGDPFLSSVYPAENIYERLKYLIIKTDVFIIQVGGIGTLSELALVLDEARKQEEKPKIFLIGEYWKPLMELSMIPKSVKALVTYIVDIQQLHLYL